MNLLADESVDRPIIDRLRRDGHSVRYIAESDPGIHVGSTPEAGPSLRAGGHPELDSWVFRRICGQNGGLESLVRPTACACARRRRVAPLRPRCAGLTAWTPAPRMRVPALVVELLNKVWVG